MKPTVIVLPTSGLISVSFNIATIAAIEEATDLTTGDLLHRFAEMMGAKTAAGTPDHQAILRSFSISLVAKFVGACLRMTRDELAAQIPPGDLLPAFSKLAEGFSAAATELYSAGDSDDTDKPADPPAPGGGAG